MSMKTDEMVFLFPKNEVRKGGYVRVELASENNNALTLVDAEGRAFVLLRDENTHPFWRDIFNDELYGISVNAK